MKPEKQNLIRDLLAEDSRREETLLAGARILRRRRHWRAVRQGMALAAMALALTLLWMKQEQRHSAPAQVAKMVPKSESATQVEALSDDQLLSLFPKTPVGLASLIERKKAPHLPRTSRRRTALHHEAIMGVRFTLAELSRLAELKILQRPQSVSLSRRDFSRLGSGERNPPKAEAREEPSERERTSHWVRVRASVNSIKSASLDILLTPPASEDKQSSHPIRRTAGDPA